MVSEDRLCVAATAVLRCSDLPRPDADVVRAGVEGEAMSEVGQILRSGELGMIGLPPSRGGQPAGPKSPSRSERQRRQTARDAWRVCDREGVPSQCPVVPCLKQAPRLLPLPFRSAVVPMWWRLLNLLLLLLQASLSYPSASFSFAWVGAVAVLRVSGDCFASSLPGAGCDCCSACGSGDLVCSSRACRC